MAKTNRKTLNSSRGFSLIETLMVVTIGTLLTGIAVPQMIKQRRLIRTVAVTREISAQLRFARQLAMSQRQSVTFQYDDAATKKQINIINHNNNQSATPACNFSRTAIFAVSGFPNTSCSTVVAIHLLAQGGLPVAEITYGIPSGAQLPAGAPIIPVTKLDDNIVMTPLSPAGAGGKLNITFQADGSVTDATGFPVDRAMYFFNNQAAQATTSAISVAGASGRVKVWRYSVSGNNFIE